MKMYIVFNQTDGILASADYMTEAQADTFIRNFPKRFAHQGFYRTSGGEHIDPADVVLEKQEAYEDDDDMFDKPTDDDYQDYYGDDF